VYRNFGNVFGEYLKEGKVDNIKELGDENARFYDEDVPGEDAEQLRQIILHNTNIWDIATYSYNLGKQHTAPNN
jgi:hypothetical protein